MKTRVCTVRHESAQTANNCDICGPKRARTRNGSAHSAISAAPPSLARPRSVADTAIIVPRNRQEEREADLAEAREAVVQDVSNDWDNRWDKVMGVGAARTTANTQKYHEIIGDMVDSDPELGKKIERRAAALSEFREPARAFRAGEEHPYDEYFEDIWEGRAGGFSEDKTIASLAEHEKMLEGLRAGTVKPAAVVGGGYRNGRKVAEEWLEKAIASDKEALETRGRSHSVNFSNARGRYRRGAGGD